MSTQVDLNQTILAHVEKLPPALQSEVLDFVLYLEQKAQRHTPPMPAERRKKLADAFDRVVALNPFSGVDPLAWQTEQRQDRPLPGRDE